MSWLKDWFSSVLDAITSIPENFLEWLHQMQYKNIVDTINDYITEDDLNGYYNALQPEWRDDAGVKAHYEARKSQVSAAGFKSYGDIAAGFFGTQIAKAIWLVKDKALPLVFDWIEDMKGSYTSQLDQIASEHPEMKDALESQKREYTKNLDQTYKLAESGEFGLNAVVSFILGATIQPIISTSTAPVWEFMGQYVWQGMPIRLLDPGMLVDLVYKDPAQREKYISQMRKYGLSRENIEAALLHYKYIPSASDIVRFSIREAYDDAYAQKWGSDLESPETVAKPDIDAAGLENHFKKYWRAHWEVPSLTMGFEMLHRQIINDADIDDLLFAQDVMPGWRERLKKLSYNPITRVDLRRMWDLRTITRERLYKGHLDLGYSPEDAELMTLWSIINILAGDLKDRYKKGWITELKVKEELLAAGMPEERVTEWVQNIVENTGEERVATERDLTKSEIVKGVKQGLLSVAEGKELLEDLGYDASEADYIIAVNVAVLEGSPETFQEFKALTSLRKKARGEEAILPTEELLAAEKEYRKKKTPETELKYRDLLIEMEKKAGDVKD